MADIQSPAPIVPPRKPDLPETDGGISAGDVFDGLAGFGGSFLSGMLGGGGGLPGISGGDSGHAFSGTGAVTFDGKSAMSNAFTVAGAGSKASSSSEGGALSKDKTYFYAFAFLVFAGMVWLKKS